MTKKPRRARRGEGQGKARAAPFFTPFRGVATTVAAAGARERHAPEATPAATDADTSFAALMYGVTPVAASRQTPPVAPTPSDDEARRELHALVTGGSERFEVSDDGRSLVGRRVDVDARLVRRLRRGELSIDVRLDLHGMRAHEARAALASFLGKVRALGERVALVIHGKGSHSAGPPVLRGEIAAWLSQAEASAHVAAFATALPDDGGEGAVYVLLRR